MKYVRIKLVERVCGGSGENKTNPSRNSSFYSHIVLKIVTVRHKKDHWKTHCLQSGC